MLRPLFFSFLILLAYGVIVVRSQSLTPKPTPTIIPKLEDNSTPITFSVLYQVGEVKGTVRNKAIDLPKPTYPYEAISLDASGKVRVDVVISEEGSVVVAKARVGPESLRPICEDTARRTRFLPFRIDGQATQTTGEIVYQFEIAKPRWIQIGYEIGGLSTRGSIRYFPSTAIAMAFDPGWIEENRILQRLAGLRQEEVTKYPFELPKERPFIRIITNKFDDGSRQTLSTVETRQTNPSAPTIEQIHHGEELTRFLRERLSNSEIDLWHFNLGVELSTAFGARNDLKSRLLNARALKKLIDIAPKSVDPSILQKLEKINGLLKEQNRIFDVDLNLYKDIVSVVVAEYRSL